MNEKIPILESDLHPSNVKMTKVFPPVTACQVLDLLRVISLIITVIHADLQIYRIKHSVWLEAECSKVNKASGAIKEELKLSLLTQVLVDTGLLFIGYDVKEISTKPSYNGSRES